MGCTDVRSEKKGRVCRGEAGTGYLPNGRNKVKLWRQWGEF